MNGVERSQDIAWGREFHQQLSFESHEFKSAIGRLLDPREPSGRWFLGGLGTLILFRNPVIRLAGLLASGIGIFKATVKAFGSSPK